MPPPRDPLTASERNALGTATSTATGITAALRILQTFQRADAVSDEANARAESIMTTLRDQQGARDSAALGNAAFAQAQRLIVLAQTREDLAVAQRLLELAQQQHADPSPTTPPPGGHGPPAPGNASLVPTWVWVAGGLVAVTAAAVAGGLYVARRQRMAATPPPSPPSEPRRARSKAPAHRGRGRQQPTEGNAGP